MNSFIPRALFLANLALSLTYSGCNKHEMNPNSHYQAAFELAQLEYGPERMTLATSLSASEMVKDGSIRPDQESRYKDWFVEVTSDKHFLEEIAKIQMNSYSEKELRDFIAFYHTPSGRRMLQVEPIIAKAIKTVADKNTQDHLPSLTSKYLAQPDKK